MAQPANNLQHLLDNNQRWAKQIKQDNAQFFSELSAQHKPQYMWIGCADARVPANELLGLLPGEVFVHRNVANLVVPSDLNSLSALQYAVDVLQVKHVIICGHHACGGVTAVWENRRVGLVDNWLRPIHQTKAKYAQELANLTTSALQIDRLCELNVIEQVISAAQSTVIQDAWLRGQDLTLHGWVYDLHDGLLHSLGWDVNSAEAVNQLLTQSASKQPI